MLIKHYKIKIYINIIKTDNNTWISNNNICFIINRNHAKDNTFYKRAYRTSKTNKSIFYINIHAI